MAGVAEGLRKRGCKLVLVGDPDQLQPIEAGTPFKEIVETHGAARLVEIRRQASEWQRQASCNLADGKTEMAIAAYSNHGSVHSDQSREHAIAALVDDYMADWQDNPKSSRLALAHRRKDVHAINQAIKSARRANGKTKTETLFETDHGPRSFAPGDRLLFTRNDATLNVRNGMLGTVTKVGHRQLTISLDPNGDSAVQTLTFAPKTFTAIDHGFAVSIHRSQGCTVDRSFVLDSRTMDANLTYVALTRHKTETALYTAPEIKRKQISQEPTISALTDFSAKLPARSR
jgi:ATP-dependent exoDNAse (exonuclease V) alpha subunit